MRHLTRLLVVIVAVVLVASACGGEPSTSADLIFSDMWSREPVAGQSTSAVYGTVTNNGSDDITITSVSTDVSSRSELHETLMEDGQMTMRERNDGFVVPAGGSFTFEPGGPHVMVWDIDPATYPSVVDVTFEFDRGPSTFASATVRPIGGMADMEDMDHADMDHAGMDDADG